MESPHQASMPRFTSIGQGAAAWIMWRSDETS
jgi:hypothetical protein